MSEENVHQHLDAIAREAGLGIMGSDGVLGILADRGEVSTRRLLMLDADDVEPIYEQFIAPAIDRLEQRLTR